MVIIKQAAGNTVEVHSFNKFSRHCTRFQVKNTEQVDMVPFFTVYCKVGGVMGRRS